MRKDSKKETAKSKRESRKVARLRSLGGLADRDTKSLVIGMDVGDRISAYCVRNVGSADCSRGTAETRAETILAAFQDLKRQRAVIKTGTHSRWMAKLLELLGHEVIVGNAPKLKMISENNRKSDKVDASLLSELGCGNLKWLHGVYQRTEATQNDLLITRARQALVDSRSALINHVRGVVKSFDSRLPACGSEAFPEVAMKQLPQALRGR